LYQNFVYAYYVSFMHATFPTHLILALIKTYIEQRKVLLMFQADFLNFIFKSYLMHMCVSGWRFFIVCKEHNFTLVTCQPTFSSS